MIQAAVPAGESPCSARHDRVARAVAVARHRMQEVAARKVVRVVDTQCPAAATASPRRPNRDSMSSTASMGRCRDKVHDMSAAIHRAWPACFASWAMRFRNANYVSRSSSGLAIEPAVQGPFAEGPIPQGSPLGLQGVRRGGTCPPVSALGRETRRGGFGAPYRRPSRREEIEVLLLDCLRACSFSSRRIGN